MFWKIRSPVAVPSARHAGARGKELSQLPSSSMSAEQAVIWGKLAAFPIDDPSAEVPLSKRLSKEEEWSHEYALRVVEEYRKFLFLSMVADHMVTPSLRVDQAWHCHLLYTRSYWEGLCLRTLGRLIHHEPSKGGEEEEKHFGDLYGRTLDLYARFFGEPPEDIWGCRHGEHRSPAACRGVTGPAPGEPIPDNERELLSMIEKAALRLKSKQP